MDSKKNNTSAQESLRVPIWGYLALIFAILFFSGIFAKMTNGLQSLDFNTINGSFGTMKDPAKATFYGMGGFGARDGFLFAITLIPAVMLALGVVEVVDHLGGLKAAQKLLNPIISPILGLPGITGLAMITSLQSTDAGAGMTRNMRESNLITEKEKSIFAAFQFSSGASIINYLTIGSALFFALKSVPILAPLVVIFICKIIGTNIMRFYLKFTKFEEDESYGK